MAVRTAITEYFDGGTYQPSFVYIYIGPKSPTRLIERRRPKALETKEELLVVLIHIQALDTSPCYNYAHATIKFSLVHWGFQGRIGRSEAETLRYDIRSDIYI